VGQAIVAGPTALAGHISLECLVTNPIIVFIKLVFERAIKECATACF